LILLLSNEATSTTFVATLLLLCLRATQHCNKFFGYG